VTFTRDAGLEWCSDGTAPCAASIEESLVGCLVEPVDQIRDLQACLGVLPYRVFLIHARWRGGRRGEGGLLVISEVELLPSPTVVDRRNRPTKSGGTRNEGDLSLSGISLTYTEDQLLGRGSGGVPIDRDVEFFYELRTRHGNDDERIRAIPTKPPTANYQNVQWRIDLSVQHAKRGRTGAFP